MWNVRILKTTTNNTFVHYQVQLYTVHVSSSSMYIYINFFKNLYIYFEKFSYTYI